MYLRVGNLLGLPWVAANIQGKTVDAAFVSKLDIGQPVVERVRVRVSDHEVGDDVFRRVVSPEQAVHVVDRESPS